MSKKSKLEIFLKGNDISYDRAIEIISEYLATNVSKSIGGRPSQKHYLYIGFRLSYIGRIKPKFSNKQIIKFYLDSGMALNDHKYLGIKILKNTSYENILNKIRNSHPNLISGLGSLSIIPSRYKKNKKL